MIAAVSSKLMLAAMLAHAMLGCWWHHAHAWEIQPCEAATLAEEGHREVGHPVPPCCGHSHAADGHDESHDRQPHRCPAGCDEGTCTYITSPPVELLPPDRCAATCDMLPPEIGPEAALAVECAARLAEFVAGRPPGVRLADLLQVRLI